jgi:radical SAM protein with 4Fe4S-binding SPASM domain
MGMNKLSWPIVHKIWKTRPELLWLIARGVARRKATSHVDYWFGRGRSFRPPMQLDLKITNRCNMRCAMCAQWAETGYNLPKSGAELNVGECTAEHYARLAEEISAWRPLIYIWGGEPLLHPDIRSVVEELKARRLSISMVTNGTTLAENADWIVASGLEVLMVSLDGPAEIHDRVRGLPGAFGRLRRGLAAVRASRAANGGMHPCLVALITVNRENTRALPEIFEICAEEKVDFVGVYYSWFTDEAIGRSHQACFERHFGETPSLWRGYCGGSRGIDVEALIAGRRALEERRWPFPHLYIPNLPDEAAIREYYQNPSSLFGFRRCLAPYYMALILPNGDVATCRDYPDFVAGNIREQPLREIFNNERYRRFRRALKKEGLFPICARCCGLMGY